MNRFRWLSIFAALFASASVQAQVAPPAEIDLFGNDFPPMENRRGSLILPSPPGVPAPVQDDQQTLLFHNGRQIRGELAEITKDEVRWRRKDASEPLRFPRAEVRRVLLVPPAQLTNQFSTPSFSARAKIVPPPLATIKLPGSDWLRGAVTSPDGQTFALALKGGAPLQIPRPQIEWLYFGPKSPPAFDLGEGAMALEGWLSGGTPRVEWKDGTMSVYDTPWIGRALANPERFEIAFEIPAESEEGLRLWLQPFGPQPNSYSHGTVQFTLGRKTLKWLIFQDNTQPNNLPLPAEAQAESGPVRYRMLYDSLAQRVVLLRNGRQLADCSLKPKVERPDGAREQRLPRGFCFDRDSLGPKSPLQFRRLSVLPWDGVLPDATTPTATNDRLSTPTTPPLAGWLEEVREKELVFAGQTLPAGAETFVKFAPNPAPLQGVEARLSFGEQGEVSLAELQMSAGQVRGRPVFAPALELPASALQFISFAPQTAAPMAGDMLVFRNGDELAGALVAAASGAPLRWRLGSGQEIDFQTERIAGVRLTSTSQVQPAGTIELRTGERLRGTVAALDERQLRWSHALLGELTVDRARLWRLYPNASQSLRDGGQDPERWLRDTAKAKRIVSYSRRRAQSDAWLALDGRFILRAREGSTGSEQALGPACELGGGFDRFELRVDTASSGDYPAALNVNFLAPGEGGIAMNLSAYEMNLYVQNPKSPTGGANRELPFREKIGKNLRQLSLRAFVNGPAGTIDFMLNGHYLGRTGQTAAERLPGVGHGVTIDSSPYGRSQMLLSEVTITPWSGELPRFGHTAPVTVLANGDVTASAPTALTDGRWRLESEIGPLDLPRDKVQAVEFGGEMQPTKAAGRLRLVDGSALLVERFQWTGAELTAHHAALGDLRVPASAISELIYDPAPARPATVADPKKIAIQPDAPRKRGEQEFGK